MLSDFCVFWFLCVFVIIFVNDCFFGGFEFDGDGWLVIGCDGRGLLLLEEIFGWVLLVIIVFGLVVDVVVDLIGGCDDLEYVFLEVVVGLFIGWEVGFGELMLGCDSLFVVVLVCGVFGSVLCKLFLVFCLGVVVLCCDVGFEVGDGLGFLLVMVLRRFVI